MYNDERSSEKVQTAVEQLRDDFVEAINRISELEEQVSELENEVAAKSRQIDELAHQYNHSFV